LLFLFSAFPSIQCLNEKSFLSLKNQLTVKEECLGIQNTGTGSLPSALLPFWVIVFRSFGVNFHFI
jgi:hypothetical protein